MADDFIWRWVQVFPIRRLVISFQIPIRAIAAANLSPSAPSQSWVGCITNTHSGQPAYDRIFADFRARLRWRRENPVGTLTSWRLSASGTSTNSMSRYGVKHIGNAAPALPAVAGLPGTKRE
jgi:hypothetical protein